MRPLVVIPTYNEAENIPPLLKEIREKNPHVEILIVDDNSPDGTGRLVEDLKKTYSGLHLLSRQQKNGLGRAYLAGFAWGLEQKFDVVIEMDADFSHRPVDLKNILNEIVKADFCVGSRYVTGGRTVNWGWLRKLISKGGGLYSRWILGFPLRDWTGGFNAWKSDVLRAIELESVQSNGYSFQIELKYRALKKGFRGIEVPIVFEDRRVGQSKMSLGIVLEAFYRVWKIRFS